MQSESKLIHFFESRFLDESEAVSYTHLAVLGGNVLGQHLQTALGSGVGGNRLAAQLAHHGADVDALALALFHHVRQNGLGAVEGTA